MTNSIIRLGSGKEVTVQVIPIEKGGVRISVDDEGLTDQEVQEAFEQGSKVFVLDHSPLEDEDELG